jgi:hypothetical protein
VAALVIVAVLMAAFVLALYSPRAALLTGLFFGNWGGLDVDLGLRLTAYQLVLAPLCVVSLVRLLYPGQVPRALHLGWPFVAMLLYVVINSAFQVAGLPGVAINNSIFRTPEVRATIQIVLYLFSVSPVVLVPWLFRGTEDALLLFRIWFVSTLMLAVFGFAQLAVYYTTGYNPIPLGFMNVALGGSAPWLREGIVNLDGLFIYRMNSFAAEPRYLGTAFGLAMVAVQGLALALPVVKPWRLLGVWLLLLAALVLTYSTSGIAILVLGSLVLLPALWLCRVPVQRSLPTVGGVAMAVVLALGGALVVANDAGIPVFELLSERTVARISFDEALEDFDLAIAKWLADEPWRLWFGGGVGNAHLYSQPYLLPEHAAYSEGQVYTAKTLVLRIVSEQGLVGMGLFLIFYLSRMLRAEWVRRAPELMPMLPLALTLLAMAMASSQILTEVWFTAGTLVMLAGYRSDVRAAARPLAGAGGAVPA